MTEPVKSPAPDGLKRLVKVSTMQSGTKFVSDETDLKHPLRKLVSGILKNQAMTARELISCLLSEPYSISPRDLESIALVLDNLFEDNSLKVGFRVHNDNLDIEPVFQVASSDR